MLLTLPTGSVTEALTVKLPFSSVESTAGETVVEKVPSALTSAVAVVLPIASLTLLPAATPETVPLMVCVTSDSARLSTPSPNSGLSVTFGTL